MPGDASKGFFFDGRLAEGEVTDKGSINQRAVLRHRAHLVEALYSDEDPRVIRADTPYAGARASARG